MKTLLKYFAVFVLGALSMYIFLWVQVGYNLQKAMCKVYVGNDQEYLEQCSKHTQ